MNQLLQITGKAAAVSDSRPWVKYLILLYAVLFLSAVNRCCGYRTAADKQQRDPQQQIGIEYLVMLFQIPQMPLSLNRVFWSFVLIWFHSCLTNLCSRIVEQVGRILTHNKSWIPIFQKNQPRFGFFAVCEQHVPLWVPVLQKQTSRWEVFCNIFTW